jgi:hypothetical protein
MEWIVNGTQREGPGTHCLGGWVGPRAGRNGCGKSRLNRSSISGPSTPERVAVPTELSRPTDDLGQVVIYKAIRVWGTAVG